MFLGNSDGDIMTGDNITNVIKHSGFGNETEWFVNHSIHLENNTWACFSRVDVIVL